MRRFGLIAPIWPTMIVLACQVSVQARTATTMITGPYEGHACHAAEDVDDPYERACELYEKGRFPEALDRCREAVELAVRTKGPDDPEVAWAWELTGYVQLGMGRFTDAESSGRRSLTIAEKAPVRDEPRTVSILTLIGYSCVEQARYTAAEESLARALALAEKASGPDDPGLIPMLTTRGVVGVNSGRAAAAEPIFRRALTIHEKAGLPDSADLASILNGLGQALHRQARDPEARPIAERALALGSIYMASRPRKLARLYGDLAEVEFALGDRVLAEEHYLRDVDILERSLGPEHLDLVTPLDNLARLAYDRRAFDEGLTRVRRASRIVEKAQGATAPGLARLLLTEGSGLLKTRDFGDAEGNFRRALAIMSGQADGAGVDRAEVLSSLGAACDAQGKVAESVPIYRDAVRAAEKSAGPNSLKVGVLLNNLGEAHVQAHQWGDAMACLQRGLPIVEAGKDPFRIAVIRRNLARAMLGLGDLEAAEKSARVSMVKIEEAMGPGDGRIRPFLETLAEVLIRRGQVEEAKTLQDRIDSLSGRH